MSTRVLPGGIGSRCVRLTTLSPSCAVVMKFGNLNFLEPSGPLQACNGTALRYLQPVRFGRQSGRRKVAGTCTNVITPRSSASVILIRWYGFHTRCVCVAISCCTFDEAGIYRPTRCFPHFYTKNTQNDKQHVNPRTC